ncbi:Hypothetical predicted protein, partial [Olea europaea subsp. europaea]
IQIHNRTRWELRTLPRSCGLPPFSSGDFLLQHTIHAHHSSGRNWILKSPTKCEVGSD